jgi:hypothetical protein
MKHPICYSVRFKRKKKKKWWFFPTACSKTDRLTDCPGGGTQQNSHMRRDGQIRQPRPPGEPAKVCGDFGLENAEFQIGADTRGVAFFRIENN